jgi:hypothetical protein
MYNVAGIHVPVPILHDPINPDLKSASRKTRRTHSNSPTSSPYSVPPLLIVVTNVCGKITFGLTLTWYFGLESGASALGTTTIAAVMPSRGERVYVIGLVGMSVYLPEWNKSKKICGSK